MSVFPVLDPSSRNCDQPGVCTLIRHGQVSKQYKAFGAEGFTPLAEAIWSCLPALMRQRTSRHILLIFTDGEPDSVPKAKMALRDAAALGVETYAVSYDSDAVKMLFPEHRCAVITNIDALPGVLTNMLRSALQRAA
jgi:nitric oxide reductase activation protein